MQGARGARHRPPVDVRVDHRHDPRPRLRLQEGHRARADLPRVLGRRRCSSSTSGGSSTTTSPRAMEDDLDRIAAGDEQRVDWLTPLLLRRRTATRACTRSSPTTSTRSTRARSTRSRSATASSLRVGRYGPYLERDGQRASVPDDMAPDELTVEKAEELLAQPSRRPRARHRPGDRPRRSSRAPAATARTSPRCCRRARRRSRAPRRSSRRCRSRRSRSTTRSGCSSLPRVRRRRRGRRGGRRAERPLRPVHQEGQGDALARARGAALHGRRSRRRSRCSRSRRQRRGRGRPPSRRSRELGADPVERQADRASRTAASARTSPTARRTRACAAATIRETLTLDRARRAARRAPREGPGEEARPRRKRFLNGSPQTFADRRRRKLDGPGRRAEYTCRAARSSDGVRVGAAALRVSVATGGFPS